MPLVTFKNHTNSRYLQTLPVDLRPADHVRGVQKGGLAS